MKIHGYKLIENLGQKGDDFYTKFNIRKSKINNRDIAIIGTVNSVVTGPSNGYNNLYSQLWVTIKPELQFHDEKPIMVMGEFNGLGKNVLYKRSILEDKITSNGVFAFCGNMMLYHENRSFSNEETSPFILTLDDVFYHREKIIVGDKK
ncbi:MAG: hypothetical protein ABIB43_03840 [archaeon]